VIIVEDGRTFSRKSMMKRAKKKSKFGQMLQNLTTKSSNKHSSTASSSFEHQHSRSADRETLELTAHSKQSRVDNIVRVEEEEEEHKAEEEQIMSIEDKLANDLLNRAALGLSVRAKSKWSDPDYLSDEEENVLMHDELMSTPHNSKHTEMSTPHSELDKRRGFGRATSAATNTLSEGRAATEATDDLELESEASTFTIRSSRAFSSRSANNDDAFDFKMFHHATQPSLSALPGVAKDGYHETMMTSTTGKGRCRAESKTM